ncbi:hypothetical protein PQ459_10060 [Chryseobacterium sp. KACC 21268]|nr:hypothetical protein PQ459_10060 [Chryseobacterium sp. KACC 21268]
MKTEINLEQYNFEEYDRVYQISDCPRSGLIRVIGVIGENYNFREKRWYISAETNYINKDSGIHLKEFKHSTLSKGRDWLISNDYMVMLTDSAGNPLPNPNFKATAEIEIEGEIQIVPKEITYENSPYKLMPAFNRYSSFKRREENPVSMYLILQVAISNDDAMGYFDNKESHPDVLDIVKDIFNQQNPA